VGEGRRKREVYRNKGKRLNLIYFVQQDDVLVNNSHWYTIDLVNILTYYYRCTLHSTLNPFFLDSFIFWGSSTGGLLIIILGRGFVKTGGAWILKEW
jgi:hypothetical protein